MSKVVAFKDSILPGEANPDLVSDIEALLAMAKSGHIQAIAYAVVKIDDVISTGWNGSGGMRSPLGCALGILNSRYFREIDDNSQAVRL